MESVEKKITKTVAVWLYFNCVAKTNNNQNRCKFPDPILPGTTTGNGNGAEQAEALLPQPGTCNSVGQCVGLSGSYCTEARFDQSTQECF
jgi:hypothetical protein